MGRAKVYHTGDVLREPTKLTYIMESEPKVYWDRNKNKEIKLRKAFFLCECGKLTESFVSDVTQGKARSCGCVTAEKIRGRMKTHGKSHHELYSTYRGMLRRCSPNNSNEYVFRNYAGRGIKICNRWLSKEGFDNFCKDMGDRPEGFSLDRIDTNGDYCPENCRWADLTTQGYNKRLQSNNTTGCPGVSFEKPYNRYIAYIKKDGITKTLGRFKTFDDAVKARRQAELEFYGYNNNYWLEKE